MENNFYSGLSRTFEAYFPQAKDLLNEARRYYNNSLNTNSWNPNDLANATKIGEFEISQEERDNLFPKLTYKVEIQSLKNPKFYIITTPHDEIVHIGTREKGKTIKPLSVSALTGGIFPSFDSKDAFAAYLRVMIATSFHSSCFVYEVNTEFKNTFKDQCGNSCTFANSDFAVDNVIAHITEVANADGGVLFQKDSAEQNARIQKLWEFLKAFGNLKKTGALENAIENNKTPKKVVNISAAVRGNKIIVSMDLDLHSIQYDKRQQDYDEGLKNLVSKSTVALCQPERDNDKGTSEMLKRAINQHYSYNKKNIVDDNGKKTLKKGPCYKFETTIKYMLDKPLKITYINIGHDREMAVIDVKRHSSCGCRHNSQIIIEVDGASDIGINTLGAIMDAVYDFSGLTYEKSESIDITSTEAELLG